MFRFGCLGLFVVLWGVPSFAQTKRTPPAQVDPFPVEMPGEVISKPSNPNPDGRPILSVSYSNNPTGETKIQPTAHPASCRDTVEGGMVATNPSCPPKAGPAQSTGCLDRLSSWMFYRPEKTPHYCGPKPTPYHPPLYAFFNNPPQATGPMIAGMKPACTTCVPSKTLAANTEPKKATTTKAEPRPVVSSTAAALAQTGGFAPRKATQNPDETDGVRRSEPTGESLEYPPIYPTRRDLKRLNVSDPNAP